MKIVVLDGHTLNPGDNPWAGVAELGELTVHDRTAPDRVLERTEGADIILTNKTRLTAETLAALPRLKFISVLATGHDAVDSKAARGRGIPVSNVPSYGTGAVAQHAVALLLELCHRAGLHDEAVRAGEWARQPDFCFWKSPMVELTGLKLGIVGYGRIGQQVARIAHALGMEILCQGNPRPAGESFPVRGVSPEELARESDVISLHCALTPANRGFVNREFLSRVKPTCLLVNTARGALIDEAALAEALREGRLGGAALDVLSAEPPAPAHPLFSAPRCIVTPHMAWSSLPARRKLMRVTEENVRAFLAGSPVNVVNA